MKAKICDSCGAMWVDNDNCKVEIIPIKLLKKIVLWEKVGKFHLCKDCYKELLTYITLKNKDNETNTNSN